MSIKFYHQYWGKAEKDDSKYHLLPYHPQFGCGGVRGNKIMERHDGLLG